MKGYRIGLKLIMFDFITCNGGHVAEGLEDYVQFQQELADLLKLERLLDYKRYYSYIALLVYTANEIVNLSIFLTLCLTIMTYYGVEFILSGVKASYRFLLDILTQHEYVDQLLADHIRLVDDTRLYSINWPNHEVIYQ